MRSDANGTRREPTLQPGQITPGTGVLSRAFANANFQASAIVLTTL